MFLRSFRFSLALAAGMLGGPATSALAQPTDNVPPAAAPSPNAAFRVRAFTEEDRVRIEAHAPDGVRLTGPATATITAASGTPLWSGRLDAGASAMRSRTVDGLRPALWSPATPTLYSLVVEAPSTRGVLRSTVRVGFRSFKSEGGKLYLNGRPIFLRGNAINPPDRTLPKPLDESPVFARAYLSDLRKRGINIVRFNRTSQPWLDAADEVGMMVFQGEYGTPEGGSPTRPPRMTDAELARYYREDVLGPLASHPSVVVYVLSNEQASADIGYLRTGHAAVDSFLTRAYRLTRPWDSTRAYIGNAGYGMGRAGDVTDIHRYWGWYYNSFLSFYTLREPLNYWRNGVQPITISEAVGNYTGPDGRFNLVPDTKQPDSQLNWTGHAPDAEQSARALAYQAFVAKQAIEITRRSRVENPHLHGLMPFSIPFYRWWGVERYEDMGAKPILDQYAVSYQPVLLSFENWTPHAYAGSTVRVRAHAVNDDDHGRGLQDVALDYELVGTDGRVVLTGREAFGAVPYYAVERRLLSLRLPGALPTGDYTLRGTLSAGDSVVSRNETPLWVAAPTFARMGAAPDRTLRVYDPIGATNRALRAVGVPFEPFVQFGELDPARDVLVVGQDAWDAGLAARAADLRAFLGAGGRAVVLAQQPGAFDGSWLPARVTLQTEPLDHPNVFPGGRPFRNGMAVNPERPDHAVFEGLSRDRLFLWSDATGWDPSKPGFPAVYPVTSGFVLADPAEGARASVLADYDHGLQGIALAELFAEGQGGGSALVTGFDLTGRAGLDPAADRLLANVLRYAASDAPHHPHVLVDAPVRWGDYASERGLVAGIRNGLLVHTEPVVPEGLRERFPVTVDAQGNVLAGGRGGWNSKPSVQYVPRGRRPFGPFTFTTGGSQQLARDAAPEGEGTFWLRVPAGRTAMATTVRNLHTAPLALEIAVDGVARRVDVAPGAEQVVSTPVRPAPDGTLAVRYRGDRRLVLVETRFE